MSGLLLGVDVGTSSTKGVLVRPDGEVVATAERPHDLSLPRPGWAEHDAEKVWWSDFVSTCRGLLEGADDGGTKGGLWTQIVSDVTGRPHDLPEQTIGAAYGDALLAARAVGLAEPDADWSRIVDTVEPDEANRELYDELYGDYRELYPATRGQMHRLAGLQKGGGDVVT